MAEQRIVITIDENGKMNASTEGIKGEVCLDELQAIMDSLEELQSITKTDEFYQTQIVKPQTKIQNKKS